MNDKLHLLGSATDVTGSNFSFLHRAAAAVAAYVEAHPEMTCGEAHGKMYGVLVVEVPDGTRGFLAAHSGLLGGRNDWPWFVPPVYDAQQPDGHFKTHERLISALNREIALLQSSPELASARCLLDETRREAEATVATARDGVRERKARRDALRRAQPLMDEEQKAALIRESQHDKAELRRTVKAAEADVNRRKAAVADLESRIASLRRERRERSDSLQRWLFTQYSMLNARGESRTLTDIFADATHTLPPAGAGDCCAPKLLQHAYANHLRPLALAEFWLGTPPPTEVRHHLRFYPPCRSKCHPILRFMLQGLPSPLPGAEDVYPISATVADLSNAETGGNAVACGESYPQSARLIHILYEDDHMAVLSKPPGMLSVPGKDGRPSVESLVRSRYAIAPDVPVIVHRLDMDTSGLLLVALSREAHKALQRQFLDRTVSKRYVALLEGVPKHGTPRVEWRGDTTGTIDLPLRPDLDDRPRQLVDFDHGKPARTRFCLLRVVDGHQLVALTPVTGRTHQLRLHCAHRLGLDCPILGDPLYGSVSSSQASQNGDSQNGNSQDCGTHTPDTPRRLCLHAEQITFRHPVTGKLMTFREEADFLRAK